MIFFYRYKDKKEKHKKLKLLSTEWSSHILYL